MVSGKCALIVAAAVLALLVLSINLLVGKEAYKTTELTNTASSPVLRSLRPIQPPLPAAFEDGDPLVGEELLSLLRTRSVPDRSIAVTLVSKGMLDFAYNWLCSVRRFNFTTYVFLASDEKAYHYLKRAGEPVILPKIFSNSATAPSESAGISTNRRLVYLRELVVQFILENEYKVLLFDADQVWTANPFHFIDRTGPADVQVQHSEGEGNRPCMGFMYLKPTSSVLSLWEEMRKISADRLERPDWEIDPGVNMEQRIFDRLRRKRQVRVEFLNRELFMNGDLADSHPPSAIAPVLISNGILGGRQQAESRGLWMVHEVSGQDKDKDDVVPFWCDYSHAAIPIPMAPPVSPSSRRRFVIKILPSFLLAATVSPPSSSPQSSQSSDAGEHQNEDDALARVYRFVNSFLAADYSMPKDLSSPQSMRVELFHRPHHRAEYVELVDQIRAARGDDVHAMELTRGRAGREKNEGIPPQKSESESEAPLPHDRLVEGGGVDLMLGVWNASSDSELVVFLADDVELSPQWWKWLTWVADGFYCRRPGFDPRVYGVVLERADDIPDWVYRSRDRFKPDTLLKRFGRGVMARRSFLFQGMGEHAALIFPQHWRRFKSWVHEWRTAHPSEVPLKLDGHDADWTQWHTWWTAYSAIHGFVGLHPPVLAEGVIAAAQEKLDSGEANLLSHAWKWLPLADAAYDFAGNPWKQTRYLEGRIDPLTRGFRPPTAEEIERIDFRSTSSFSVSSSLFSLSLFLALVAAFFYLLYYRRAGPAELPHNQ